MGSGASIEFNQPKISDGNFKELMSDAAAREKLFDAIAQVGTKEDGTSKGLKGKVSVSKLVQYFSDEKNSLFPGFKPNVDVLNQAYQFTCKFIILRKSEKKNKKKKNKKFQESLTKPQFHKFLPILLLFTRLWDLFDAADKLVVEDQKVFKGEFMKIREKFSEDDGISVLGEISKEEWESEFQTLDKNNDGFVSFQEVCTYAVDRIKKPFDYKDLDDDEEDDDEEDDDGEEEEEGVTKPLVEVKSSSYINGSNSQDAIASTTQAAAAGVPVGDTAAAGAETPTQDDGTAAILREQQNPADITSTVDKSTAGAVMFV